MSVVRLFLIALLLFPSLAGASQRAFLQALAKNPCAAGEWGTLKCIRITIAPSDEIVEEYFADYPLENPWYFSKTTPAQLKDLWRRFGLQSKAWEQVLSSATAYPAIQGYALNPPTALVESLTPSQRTALYDLLAENSLNVQQSNAFRFNGTSVQEWLGNAGLSADLVRRVSKLVYRDNETLFFSDFSLLFPQIPSQRDRFQILKALSREATYLLKLKVAGGAPVTGLAAYWGQSKRKKDVLPILESLARLPNGEFLDVAHLLPGFARRLLFTYPSLKNDVAGTKHDCFWSALNFQSEIPNDAFTDLSRITAEFKTHYTPVLGAPTLGDILVYSSAVHGDFHAAVYIAGGFVFTKNGTRLASPWMLMTLGEMEKYYAEFEDVRIRIYRPNAATRTSRFGLGHSG